MYCLWQISSMISRQCQLFEKCDDFDRHSSWQTDGSCPCELDTVAIAIKIQFSGLDKANVFSRPFNNRAYTKPNSILWFCHVCIHVLCIIDVLCPLNHSWLLLWCACYCYLGSVLFVFVFDCGLNSGWLCLTNVWGENWFPALLGLSPVFTTSIDRSCLLSVKNSHIVCQGLFSGLTDNLVYIYFHRSPTTQTIWQSDNLGLDFNSF